MNTFFRICVYFCIALMVFTLLLNFVAATGAFSYTPDDAGKEITDTGTVLEDVTALEEPNMDYLWLLVVGGIGAGLVVGALTHSVVPAGIFVFGSIFWASFINVHGILSIGGFIPTDLLTIFTVGVVFIFIAAIVGMLTGSG